MDDRRTFTRLDARVAVERLRAGAEAAWPARERRALFVDEVDASCRLAGCALERPAVVALVTSRTVVGNAALDDYVLADDYIAAARHVAAAALPGPRRPYLRIDEIVELHKLAARRSLQDAPGSWRRTTAPAFGSGMVPPPAWLVPGRITAYVDRFAAGPRAGEPALLWAAEAHERFARIHPFATANGRVGRLVLGLLLRRVGLPAFVPAARRSAAYVSALARADAGDLWPLACALARGVLASLVRLAATAESGELAPLAALATLPERAALYKAAQRGRLRTLRRGGTLLTTRAWLDEYRASRSRTARDDARRRPTARDDA